MPTADWLANRGRLKDTQAESITAGNYAKRIGELPEAFVDDGMGMQSANPEVSLNGLPTPQAKARIIEWLVRTGDRARCHQVQIARLALQPTALLGRTDSDSA